MKKFKLREDLTQIINGVTLYRIEALRDFSDVKKGDLGGWVEKESNLSHFGDCWIYAEGQVYENARVSGDARIQGNARVYGYARIYGNARVCGYARIYGNARVYGCAWVYGNAKVYGFARIRDTVDIYGNSKVFGVAAARGSAQICGNATVFYKNSIYTFELSGRHLTFCTDEKLGISVTVDCQETISLDEFENKIYNDGEYDKNDLPQHRKEYLKAIEIAKEFMANATVQ